MRTTLTRSKEKYLLLIEKHNQFAKAYKQAGLAITMEMNIAPLNELRYALRALIDLLSLDFDEQALDVIKQ